LQSRGKKIKVKVSYASRQLKIAKFLNDQRKYQQVLLNILSNAVIYSPTGSTIEISISSCVLEQEKRDVNNSDIKTLLSVIVQDKGPGISLEDQKKLFQPFSTLEANRHLNPKGVGIGLYVSKLICDKLEGDISCFSNPEQGLGSTFEFRLQLMQVSDH